MSQANTKKKKISSYNINKFLIVFSFIYIFTELTFNISFVDYLNSASTYPVTFNTFLLLGKILSSIGLGLFLCRFILLFKKVEKVWGYGSFFLISVLSFSSQTFYFNNYLDNLTQEQKLSAYTFSVYRDLNLNNDKNFQIFKNENINYDSSVISLFGIFNNNPNVDNKINNFVNKSLINENSLDQKVLGQIYDEINFSLPNIESYWQLYYIESARYAAYKGLFQKQYLQNFSKSVGMPPSLNKVEFEKRLRSSSNSLQDFNKITLLNEQPAFQIKGLHLGDIPLNLNKEQWMFYINSYVNTSIQKNLFNIKNVDTLPNYKEMVSSTLLSQYIVSLSIISLLLNVVVATFSLSKIAGSVILPIVLGVGFFFSTYNPYHINDKLNYIAAYESQTLKYFSFYRPILHSLFVNTSYNNSYKFIMLQKPVLPNMDKLKSELDIKFRELKSTGNLADNQNLNRPF